MTTAYLSESCGTIVRNMQQLCACEGFLPQEAIDLPEAFAGIDAEWCRTLQDLCTLEKHLSAEIPSTNRQLQTFAGYFINSSCAAFRTELHEALREQSITDYRAFTACLSDEYHANVFLTVLYKALYNSIAKSHPELKFPPFSPKLVSTIRGAVQRSLFSPFEFTRFTETVIKAKDDHRVLYETYGIFHDRFGHRNDISALMPTFLDLFSRDQLLFIERVHHLIYDLNVTSDDTPIKPTKEALREQVHQVVEASGLAITPHTFYLSLRSEHSSGEIATGSIAQAILTLFSEYIEKETDGAAREVATHVAKKLGFTNTFEKLLFTFGLAKAKEHANAHDGALPPFSPHDLIEAPQIPDAVIGSKVPRGQAHSLNQLIRLSKNISYSTDAPAFYMCLREIPTFLRVYTEQVQKDFELTEDEVALFPYFCNKGTESSFKKAAEHFLNDLLFSEVDDPTPIPERAPWLRVKEQHLKELRFSMGVDTTTKADDYMQMDLATVIAALYDFIPNAETATRIDAPILAPATLGTLLATRRGITDPPLLILTGDAATSAAATTPTSEVSERSFAKDEGEHPTAEVAPPSALEGPHPTAQETHPKDEGEHPTAAPPSVDTTEEVEATKQSEIPMRRQSSSPETERPAAADTSLLAIDIPGKIPVRTPSPISSDTDDEKSEDTIADLPKGGDVRKPSMTPSVKTAASSPSGTLPNPLSIGSLESKGSTGAGAMLRSVVAPSTALKEEAEKSKEEPMTFSHIGTTEDGDGMGLDLDKGDVLDESDNFLNY